MQVEINSSERVIVGGYTSHGWIRDDSQALVRHVGNALMDLNMIGHGGDETTFLFNLTHNLRFSAVNNNEKDSHIYTQTVNAQDDYDYGSEGFTKKS